MRVQSLGHEDSLKKGMATHPSLLAWRIPWKEEFIHEPCQVGPPKTDRSLWSFDKMWSTGEGNGKTLQYSCFENPMNSMKRQNGMTRDELPRSVSAHDATGEE